MDFFVSGTLRVVRVFRVGLASVQGLFKVGLSGCLSWFNIH